MGILSFDYVSDPNIPREECTSGELRLEGGGGLMSGNLSLQGRVELCLNNAWGTVCNSRFGSEELQVVCTQITGVTHDVGKELKNNNNKQTSIAYYWWRGNHSASQAIHRLINILVRHGQ